MIRHINLDMKQTGERNAGNPHVAFDVAGAGNGFTNELVRHSQRKRGEIDRLSLRIPRQSSTLLPELQKKIEQFNESRADLKLINELLRTDIPLFERELEEQKKGAELVAQIASDRARPSKTDLASFAALRAWFALNMAGGNPPEIELRQSFETNPDGSVGKPRPHPAISSDDARWEKFTTLPVPVLAIYSCPPDLGPAIDNDPKLREQFDAFKAADCQARAKALEKDVPSARVLLWPHVYHYLFIAQQEQVLRELRTFMDSLPQ